VKILKLELSIAKAKHAALKATTQLPDVKTYNRALDTLEKIAPDNEYHQPERRRALQVVADRDAVLAYRKEKQRLHDAVIAVQEKILAAQTASDLE
jgi:hypothetical protein